MSDFVFHPVAAADLDGIVRYTRRKWGEAQARSYAARLKQCAFRCASGIGSAARRWRSTAGPRVRCEQHLIVFLRQDDEPLLIIAILHQRMDIERHIVQRLRAIGSQP